MMMFLQILWKIGLYIKNNWEKGKIYSHNDKTKFIAPIWWAFGLLWSSVTIYVWEKTEPGDFSWEKEKGYSVPLDLRTVNLGRHISVKSIPLGDETVWNRLAYLPNAPDMKVDWKDWLHHKLTRMESTESADLIDCMPYGPYKTRIGPFYNANYQRFLKYVPLNDDALTRFSDHTNLPLQQIFQLVKDSKNIIWNSDICPGNLSAHYGVLRFFSGNEVALKWTLMDHCIAGDLQLRYYFQELVCPYNFNNEFEVTLLLAVISALIVATAKCQIPIETALYLLWHAQWDMTFEVKQFIINLAKMYLQTTFPTQYYDTSTCYFTVQLTSGSKEENIAGFICQKIIYWYSYVDVCGCLDSVDLRDNSGLALEYNANIVKKSEIYSDSIIPPLENLKGNLIITSVSDEFLHKFNNNNFGK